MRTEKHQESYLFNCCEPLGVQNRHVRCWQSLVQDLAACSGFVQPNQTVFQPHPPEPPMYHQQKPMLTLARLVGHLPAPRQAVLVAARLPSDVSRRGRRFGASTLVIPCLPFPRESIWTANVELGPKNPILGMVPYWQST